MGLCKCPKKRVTNQFCFEHRVNVCEHCLVANHPKCIIQSYLKWLQDSDYEPLCQLCKRELKSSEDCVRLLCYDVFHWSCFNEYAEQLPPQTAPAGYHCPNCQLGLFPASNLVSPVADALRQTLQQASWAKMGLGLASVADSSINIPSALNQSQLRDFNLNKSIPTTNTSITMTNESVGKHVLSLDNYATNSAISTQTRITDRVESAFLPSSNNNFNPPTFAPRKLIDASSNGLLPRRYEDHDEDKYKRKSPVEMFSRWFKSRASLRKNRFNDPRLIYKRWFVLTILIFLGICTLILIFVRLGRGGSNYDPLLDPKQNPNIRVGEGAFSNQANPDSM